MRRSRREHGRMGADHPAIRTPATVHYLGANAASHHTSPGGDVGHGSGPIVKGVGNGAGSAAAGTGKAAANLAMLHPGAAVVDLGKGAGSAGKDVGVGTAKGSGGMAERTAFVR